VLPDRAFYYTVAGKDLSSYSYHTSSLPSNPFGYKLFSSAVYEKYFDMVRLNNTSRALCILILFSIFTHASEETSPPINEVAIHLAEIGTEDLEVSYTLDRPVDSLQLRTTPDQSRADFWRAKSKHFELIQLPWLSILLISVCKNTTDRFHRCLILLVG